MSSTLTGPLLAAAGVLLVSGMAKLRSPGGAVLALRAAGVPAARPLVGAAVAGELAVGLAVLVTPGRVAAAALAAAYGTLSVVGLILARHRAACGCFGHSDAPATGFQALVSAIVALAAAAGVVWPPRGLAWVVGLPPVTAVGLVAGIGGCVYAAVVAYTQLPAAWVAWSGQ
jgi:hypothetical protein